MRRAPREDAEDLFVKVYEIVPDYVIPENKIASELAKQCAIIAQKRILGLDVWNTYNLAELAHQEEILKELEKL